MRFASVLDRSVKNFLADGTFGDDFWPTVGCWTGHGFHDLLAISAVLPCSKWLTVSDCFRSRALVALA